MSNNGRCEGGEGDQTNLLVGGRLLPLRGKNGKRLCQIRDANPDDWRRMDVLWRMVSVWYGKTDSRAISWFGSATGTKRSALYIYSGC